MRFIVFLLFAFASALPASAQDAAFPIKADDGSTITNHRVPAALESQIERLPGIVVVGNAKGDVTLVEFYDLNCPFCRRAAADLKDIVAKDKALRLVLVPFPVLGIASIQAGRAELAVAAMVPPQKFFDFHHKVYAGRGVVDGSKALAAARAIGLDPAKVTTAADDDKIVGIMTAHVRMGDALAIVATPGFVIKGVVIVGYPGRKAIEGVIAAARRCGQVMCDG
jgi:protein-disulfide isomerase